MAPGYKGLRPASCVPRRHAGHPGRRLLLTVIGVGLAIGCVPSFYVTMIGGVLIFVAVDALRVNVWGES